MPGVAALVLAGLAALGGCDQDPEHAAEMARSKAWLCGVASNIHRRYIEHARASGLVRDSGVDPSGVYVFTVDEALWAELMIEEQELLAIAGWCTVANEAGEGVAIVARARDHEAIASVVNGEFATR